MSPETLPPIHEAGRSWALGCSRAGASHRRSGLPCQDAHAIWSSGSAGCLAVAVADGHGDARHDLSHLGSTLAVTVAVAELRAFYLHFGSPSLVEGRIQGGTAALKSNFKADFPRRVNHHWRGAVLEDARGRVDASADDPALFSRYGTTLLTALLVDEVLLLGQMGDGDIVLVRPDGAVDYPLPPDEAMVGNQTYSLASLDAPNLWQTSARECEAGSLLLLATDGLANSFADPSQFEAFVRSLAGRVREFGSHNIAAALPEWLDRYSELGSGDDITLALLSIGAKPQASMRDEP